MPWYPKAILGIVAVSSLLIAFVRPVRALAFRVDIRVLIAFHLVRFVGFYFFYLFALHELPYSFAILGGSGDVIVAMLALAVIFFTNFPPAVAVWNLLGLADILAVTVTAARAEIAVPGSMHQLDRFPLILLPAFIVPVIMVTHGLMLVRLMREKNR